MTGESPLLRYFGRLSTQDERTCSRSKDLRTLSRHYYGEKPDRFIISQITIIIFIKGHLILWYEPKH
jgi:hypothetical protein